MKTFTSLLSLSHTICLSFSLSLLPCLGNEPTPVTAPNTDLLRFVNNDTLHGTFLTFNETGNLLWKNSESNEVILATIPDGILFGEDRHGKS